MKKVHSLRISIFIFLDKSNCTPVWSSREDSPYINYYVIHVNIFTVYEKRILSLRYFNLNNLKNSNIGYEHYKLSKDFKQ